jgi:hypothetical protein
MGQQLKKRKFNFIQDENKVRSNKMSVIFGEESRLFQNAPFDADCVVESTVGPVKLLLSHIECQKRGGINERMA